MKESYVEGSSAPPRPRVMVVCPRGHTVSVDRGTCRPAIELRNHPIWGADRVLWKGRQHDRWRYCESSFGPTESETLSMCGSSMHENREIPTTSGSEKNALLADRSGKACGLKPDMYVVGKSDIGIVPVNAGNKAGGVEAASYGENETPSRNRKSDIGNPSPKVELALLPVRLRTRWRKGLDRREILEICPRLGHSAGDKC